MITLSDTAQEHFAKLVAQQGIDGLGIRLRAVEPGTPKGDCHLEFCEPADLDGTEWEVECRDFSLYVDAMSLADRRCADDPRAGFARLAAG